MPTRIISRAEGGIVREPPSDRGLVVRPTDWVLTHYTGGGGSVTDGKSDAQHMAELAAYARGAGKEWEYNWVITAPLGWIWEMAGTYRAAHCSNFNTQSYGIQMNLGVGAAPNAAMIESHRWLREELRRQGLWTGAQNVPHYRFRSTACCGFMMAEAPGPRWPSPTGEGSLGNLLPFMVAAFPGSPGGLFVTPDDLKILQQMEARIVAAVNGVDAQVAAIPISTPWTADGKTPLVNVVAYIMRNVTGIYLGEKLQGTSVENPNAFWPDEVSADLTSLKNTVGSIDPAALREALVTAVSDAVTVALQNVEIDANISDEDAAKIADAVVAEIAS